MSSPVILCLPLMLLPVVAQGTEGRMDGGNFGFLSSFLQMLAALALVIGLILLAYYVITHLMRKLPVLRPGNQQIRVLEVRAMGPRKSLVLIEIGGEYLLLSSSGDQLTLIKKINMLEHIEVIEDVTEKPSFLSFLRRESSRT